MIPVLRSRIAAPIENADVSTKSYHTVRVGMKGRLNDIGGSHQGSAKAGAAMCGCCSRCD
jgi:hypothetical protein